MGLGFRLRSAGSHSEVWSDSIPTGMSVPMGGVVRDCLMGCGEVTMRIDCRGLESNWPSAVVASAEGLAAGRLLAGPVRRRERWISESESVAGVDQYESNLERS